VKLTLRLSWLPVSVRRRAYLEILEAVRKIDARDVLVFQEQVLAELRRVLVLRDSDVR